MLDVRCRRVLCKFQVYYMCIDMITLLRVVVVYIYVAMRFLSKKWKRFVQLAKKVQFCGVVWLCFGG